MDEMTPEKLKGKKASLQQLQKETHTLYIMIYLHIVHVSLSRGAIITCTTVLLYWSSAVIYHVHGALCVCLIQVLPQVLHAQTLFPDISFTCKTTSFTCAHIIPRHKFYM